MTNLKRLGMGKLGLEPQILEEAEMLMAYLEEEGVIDPNKTLASFTSNNIMRMMSGQRWDYGDPANEVFVNAVNTIAESLGALMLEDLVPMFRYLPEVRKAKKEANEAMVHIRSLFRQIIEKRMAETHSVENEDFIQSFIQAHEEMEEGQVVELIDFCQTAFIAGTETTSATLNFAIVHLLNNPAWQEELFQEVFAVLKGDKPSMANMEKLPKLEATIQETLRVNPNNPLIFKATSHVTKVRDYVVPADCLVLVNAYHINYDSKTFPNPSNFSPTRWLCPDGSFNRETQSKCPSIHLFSRCSCARSSHLWHRETHVCWATTGKARNMTKFHIFCCCCISQDGVVSASCHSHPTLCPENARTLQIAEQPAQLCRYHREAGGIQSPSAEKGRCSRLEQHCFQLKI